VDVDGDHVGDRADPAMTATIRLGDREVPLIRFAGPPPDTTVVAARLAAGGLHPGSRPVVVLVGGAAGLVVDDAGPWQRLLRDGLVAGLVRADACLVDGGTNSGVLALAGAARAAAGATYPAVGVAAEGTIRWPGRTPELPDAAELGPHHTHIVTVPGDTWGTEPPWISLIATALAGPAPSVTVLINGGPITRADLHHSLTADRPVLAVTGTGRLADTLTPAPLLEAIDAMARPELLADRLAALATRA
jgi:SLOG in TRPM, prokaryote